MERSRDWRGLRVQASIKADGRNIPITSLPIEIEVYTETPQEIMKILCNNKVYSIKSTEYKKLQMTA